MRIDEARRKSTVFDDAMADMLADDDNLEEASRLLYEIMHESTRFAYNALETEVNGHWQGLTSLYCDCVTNVKRIAAGGAKTRFLAMSALEDTFRKSLPLLLVRLEDLLDGSSDMPEKAKRLMEIFRDNPYKREWERRSAEYGKLVRSLGLPASDADYASLTGLLDPLLDALTFFDGGGRLVHVKRFRLGPPGDPAVQPAFSRHVPIFESETDLVRSVLGCQKENAVTFAGLKLTYADTEDTFEAWYSGLPNERMRNVMRHEGLTEERYLVTTDPWSRTIFLCVKSGMELYVARMPYRRESYGGSAFDEKTKYCYGRRASYAPYQAFYDEPPAAPEDTAFLAVPRKGYDLASIMDREQKAWLPAFLNEVLEKFFRNGPPEAEDAYLPGERALSAAGTSYRDPAATDLVPVPSALAPVRLEIEIPDPADLFDEPFMKDLCREFGITAAGVAEHADKILRASAFEDASIENRIKKAALRLLCTRAEACLKDCSAAKSQVMAALLDGNAVADRILSGACDGFTRVTVSGPGGRTAVSDARPESGKTVVWRGPRTSGAPPVLYEARPVTAEDYAALLGVGTDGLELPLRLYTRLQAFWDKYRHSMPRPVSYNRTLEPRPLARVNLCMSKTEYKKAAKPAGKETAP